MKNLLFIRIYADGSSKIQKVPFAQSETGIIYFDDILFNSDYNENSDFIVSKIAHEKSYPDRVLANRTHKYGLLHFVLDGKGKFNDTEISANQGFITFPYEKHSISSDKLEPWHFCWIAFMGSNCENLFASAGLTREKNIFKFDYSSEVLKMFTDVIYSPHNDVDIDEYLKSIIFKLLWLHTSYKSIKKPIIPNTGKIDYATEAKRNIKSHYNEIVKIDEVAKQLHISRKYLCSIFNTKYGISPQKYLIDRRLEVATSMLINTDICIYEIASAVGYMDYTQLSRLFKRHYGCSLSQYRKSHLAFAHIEN